MRRTPQSGGKHDLIAAFAEGFKRVLSAWRLDAFEFAALVFAAVLLLCPLFRLGAWLADQRFKALRRAALEVRLDEDADEDDGADPADDADDHEAEAKMDGALEGASLRGERV